MQGKRFGQCGVIFRNSHRQFKQIDCSLHNRIAALVHCNGFQPKAQQHSFAVAFNVRDARRGTAYGIVKLALGVCRIINGDDIAGSLVAGCPGAGYQHQPVTDGAAGFAAHHAGVGIIHETDSQLVHQSGAAQLFDNVLSAD